MSRLITPARWAVRLLALLWLAVGLLLLLQGCAPIQRTPSPKVWANCPPLPAPMTRTDDDAYTRRIAAVEGWYLACQEAAPQGCSEAPPTPPAHNIAAMQRLYLPVLQARYSACRESALAEAAP